MSLFQGHRAIKVPQNITVWDVDPYSKEVLLDPETFFSALRERGPFVYLNKYKMLACGRYKETKEVFSDHQSLYPPEELEFKILNWRSHGNHHLWY